MLTTRTSRWSLGAALLCVVLLAASWFLLIDPRRAEAADIRDRTVAATDQAQQLTIQIADLKVEFGDLEAKIKELAAIKKQLPPVAAVPAFVRDLQKIAAQSGLELNSIAPGAPSLLTTEATAGTSAAGPGAVVSIPMAISITGEYFEVSLFLKHLQTKVTRSYLVTSVTGVPTPAEVVATPAPIPTPAPVETTTPVVDPSATPTPAPLPSPTPTPFVTPTEAAVVVDTLSRLTLNVSGSIFVLMDDSSTLDQVAKDVAAATGQAGTPAAPAPAAPAPAAPAPAAPAAPAPAADPGAAPAPAPGIENS